MRRHGLLIVLEAILLAWFCVLIVGVSIGLAKATPRTRQRLQKEDLTSPDSTSALSLATAASGQVKAGGGVSAVVGPTGPFDDNVTCTPLENVPAYDRVLTWYGVQTDGPITSGVVTLDMYMTNATQILNYMYQSPLEYTGICLQLDNPTGETVGQGKPPNYAAFIDEMVNLIAGIPIKYRVGFHAVVEEDATWQIVYGTPPQYLQTDCGKDGTKCAFTNYCTGSDPKFAANICAPPSTADGCNKCWWYDYKKEQSNCAGGAANGTVDGTTTCTDPRNSGPASAIPSDASAPTPANNCTVGPKSNIKDTNVLPTPGNTCAFGPADAPAPTALSCQRCYYEEYPGHNGLSNCANTAQGCPGNVPSGASVLSQINPDSKLCTVMPQPPFGTPPDPKNYTFNSTCWYESENSATVNGEPTSGPSSAWLMPTVFPDLDTLPGARFAKSTSVTNVYGGGPVPCVAGSTGPCPSIVTGGPPVFQANGQPYQTVAPPPANGESVCPYKAGPSAAYPDGCPGNMSRLAWYICYVNAKLRQMGSQQQVSMMNWDAEGNGNTGLQCATFQFLYGIRQFGGLEDVLPSVFDPVTSALVPVPWVLYQNGAAGLASGTATSNPDSTQCGYWDQVLINTGSRSSTDAEPNPVAVAGMPPQFSYLQAVSAYKDMALFQAAPEYYWFNGQDMGGVANSGKEVIINHGMLSALSKAGFKGCPQSAAGKPGVDAKCGCRRTVYESYAHKNEGGKLLLDVLGPSLYDSINDPTGKSGATGGQISLTTPTFSIEHLGDINDPLDFGECINAQNFDSQLQGSGCTLNSKCGVRCGVANFFGNWSENCFKQFLDGFAIRYGAKSVMIYDGGFLPKAWLPPNPPAPGQPFITAPNINVPKTIKSLPSIVNPACVQTDVVVCDCDAPSIAAPAPAPALAPSRVPSPAIPIPVVPSPSRVPSPAIPIPVVPSPSRVPSPAIPIPVVPSPSRVPSSAIPIPVVPSPSRAPSSAIPIPVVPSPSRVPSSAIPIPVLPSPSRVPSSAAVPARGPSLAGGPNSSYLPPAHAPSTFNSKTKNLSSMQIGIIAAAGTVVLLAAAFIIFFTFFAKKNK